MLKCENLTLSLYLVANKHTANSANRSDEEFLGIVREALQGGVDIVQLREKSLSSKDFYTLACKTKNLCDKYKIPLIINDRIDIALACGASGVHIGIKKDLPVKVARRILGKDKILGLSLNQISEIKELGEDLCCVDYLGVGAIWDTPTKVDSITIGTKGLANIALEVKKLATMQNLKKPPIVAIGGIYDTNIHELAGIDIAGVAVVRSIMDATNPTQAAQNLKSKVLEILQPSQAK